MIDPPLDRRGRPPSGGRAEGPASTAPLVEPLPRGLWVVISIDDDRATFATLADDSFWVAAVERRGDKWGPHGTSFQVARANRPSRFQPGSAGSRSASTPIPMPGAADTTIDLLVTEQGCADGREMGDALKGPQVIETDVAVLVAFAVIPVAGRSHLPGQPVDLGHHRVVRSVGPAWGV